MTDKDSNHTGTHEVGLKNIFLDYHWKNDKDFVQFDNCKARKGF